jgi:phosphopantothenoylcysteine decarboxylase/phosphopantothenate--cysteine ligase
MSRLSGKVIALAVGGEASACAAVEVSRALALEGASVHVALTPGAAAFVTPRAFESVTGMPARGDLAAPAEAASYGVPGGARAVDLFVVAPGSADVTPPPLAWVAPAGATPRDVVDAAVGRLGPRDLAGLRVLLTAGPTREPIDPVRFISNRSSGKMGYALAAAAVRRGAEVTLVSGPVALAAPAGARLVAVTSAQQMLEAALAALPGQDVVIASAAVADYRPAVVATQKIKKAPGDEVLRLERTPDVLHSLSLAAGAPRPLFVGFAAETQELLANARSKLERKGLDLVVANDVAAGDRGFEVEQNAVTLVFRDGRMVPVELQAKTALADRLLDEVVALRTALGPGQKIA